MQLVPSEDARLAPAWDVQRWFNQPGRPGLVDYRGRVVAIHAFQMLCPGCVAHGIPQAQRIGRTFGSSDVAVIGLHTVFEHHQAMGPVALEAFLHEYRVDFPVGVDAPSANGAVPATMAAYGMRGTPTLILVDRMGRLRLHAFGRLDDMAVGAAISALVAEDARGDEFAVPASRASETTDCGDACPIEPA
jgi:hypothetical protein